MPLESLQGRAWYLAGANNLGVIATGDGGAIVVDTGLDKDVGRALRKALDEAGLVLRAIISTHHHADHIGGNEYLVRAAPGVLVCASEGEAPLVANPLLEPIYLYGGAAPIKALRTKWLMAKGVPVQQILTPPHAVVAGVELEILPLPGHSLAQIGVAVDGVCFAADGFFGPAVLQKHGIPYAHDIAAQLAALGTLSARAEQVFVPGHGPPTTHADLPETIAANRRAIEHASATVQAALAEPGDLAAIARRVQRAYDLHFPGIPQYAIFVSAVAAHLSYLESQGRAQAILEEHGVIWR